MVCVLFSRSWTSHFKFLPSALFFENARARQRPPPRQRRPYTGNASFRGTAGPQRVPLVHWLLLAPTFPRRPSDTRRFHVKQEHKALMGLDLYLFHFLQYLVNLEFLEMF